MGSKEENIDYVALYRQSLLTPAVCDHSWRWADLVPTPKKQGNFQLLKQPRSQTTPSGPVAISGAPTPPQGWFFQSGWYRKCLVYHWEVSFTVECGLG